MAATLLPDDELASLRAALGGVRDLTCTVTRATRAANGYGGTTESWATVASGVACNKGTPSGGLMAQYGAVLGSQLGFHVFLPYGTDVRRDDRLTFGSDVLRVQVLLSDSSFNLDVQVLATEVK